MRVADIFTPQPVFLQLQASTDEALRVMSLHGFREYPVVVGGERASDGRAPGERVVGLVSDEELFALGAAPSARVNGHASEGERANGTSGRARGAGRNGLDGPPMTYRQVREVMRRAAVSIGPDELCTLAAWRMHETGAHALCVTVDGRLRGIVTSTNLLRAYTTFVREEGGLGGEPSVGAFTTPLDAFPAPRDPVAATCRRLRELGVRTLPVVSRGRVVGCVAVRRLLELLRAPGAAASGTIGDVMEPARATIGVGASLVEAAEGLLGTKQGALPVVDGGGRLAGIVTQRSVVKHCATANLTYGRFPV